MSLVTLNYPPSWHHIGDPDNVPLALAYGVLSLGAIILLEYIAAGVLYSKANGILISDTAATVTLNASWFDLGRWAFINKPSTRICKRAVLAIFLRYFIIAIDVLILVGSLPRSIPVYERQVGSSVISFPFRKISGGVDGVSELFNAPCKPDPIEYEGFKPEATRQLCLSSVPIPDTTEINQSALPLDFNRNDVYGVLNPKLNRALMVVHINSRLIYTYSHILRRESKLYLLPPRPGIIVEYMKTFNQVRGGRCTEATIGGATEDGNVAVIYCPKDPSYPGALLPTMMFHLQQTRKLDPGEARNKYRNLNELVPADTLFQVGTIDRPRICIIPAVIMFLSLFLVACIVRFTKGKQDLAFKQWSFVSRAYGAGEVDNPLYSVCSEFANWNTDGSISSFHQSNYTKNVALEA